MKKNLFFCFIFISCLYAEKWALCIGIDEYPYIQNFSRLHHAKNDINYISKTLESSGLNFQSEKILLLENNTASIGNIHRAFRDYLSQAKQEDFIFIYFVGHSILLNNEVRWLLHDTTFDEIDRSSLSYKQLAYLIKKYVKAKQIFVCSDARNNQKSLGKPSSSLLKYLPMYNISTLQSSAYHEKSHIKSSRSIFNYFFCMALQNKTYLNRSPDYNNDGVISIFELGNFLSWSVSLSGYRQHPFTEGKSDFLIYHNNLPHFHIQHTKRKNGKIKITGFVRFPHILQMQIEQHDVFLTKKDSLSDKYNIKNPNEIYWFTISFPFPNKANSISILFRYNNHTFLRNWQIEQLKKGWYGEQMPLGMEKFSQKGMYLWTIDGSIMSYIPKGSFVMGTTHKKLKKFTSELSDICKELQLYVALFNDEKKWKLALSHTLQETNYSILKVNKKMTSISDKIKGLDNQSTVKNKDHMPFSIVQKENIKNHIYYKKSQSILSQCYNDLQIIQQKLSESNADVHYFENLKKIEKRLYGIFGKTNQKTKGYYIDLHEITNGQFLKFCDATSRPYPSNPWWQENYFTNLAEYPVVNVSWEDARAYCLWSKKNLPTEKEWEKAARGKKASQFPWGNKLPYLELVNASVPASPEKLSIQLPLFIPQKINSLLKGRSFYGCYHMAGNVREWCANVANNSIVSHLNEYRTTKGGSFYSKSDALSSWFSRPFHVETRRSDLGFRCVVSEKK